MNCGKCAHKILVADFVSKEIFDWCDKFHERCSEVYEKECKEKHTENSNSR